MEDFCLIFIIFVQLSFLHKQAGGNNQDYCSWEVFSPSCSEDEVLVIDKALYGLMSSGRCVDEGYSQYIGCSTDLQGYLDERCSGLRACEVDVHSKDLKDSIQGTCPEPYLEVNYRCQKVINWQNKCGSSLTSLPNHPGGAYLASLVTKETTCGHGNSPLVISGQPGQTLNLTLWDFSWSTRSPWQQEGQCDVLYGHLFDIGKDDVINICGGGIRVKQLYRSTSYQVQLVLKEDIVDEYQFLIQYEVLGCPDTVPPLNSWKRKSGDTVTVGCHGTPESWQLRCVRGHWVGKAGNCTQAVVQPTNAEIKEEQEEFNGHHVLAFGLGCAALAICCVTVTLGVFCIKKYKVKLEAKYEKASASEMYLTPTNTTNWQNVATIKRPQPPHTAEGTLIRPADTNNAFGLGNDSGPAYANVAVPGNLHNTGTLLIDRSHMGTLLHGTQTASRGTADNDDNSVKYFVLEKPPGYNN